MRQVRIERARECGIVDAPPPQIAARSVLARTRCCSLLMENVAEWIGTDPRLRQPGHPYYQGFPYVMDSEIVTEVIAVGSEVQGVHEGDRFVTYGKMNELHLFEPHAWTRLPPGVTDETAVSLPFCGTALQCVRRAQIGLGEDVVVIGQGPMGLLVTMWASRAGAGRVIVADRHARRLEVAREMGATGTIDAGGHDVAEAVRDLTGGIGADIVIDAGNTARTFNLALEVARDKGRVVVLSFHTQPITIDDITKEFYHKELDVIATRGTGPSSSYRSPLVRWTSRDNLQLVARWMGEGRIEPERLITHRLTLPELQRGLEWVEGRPTEVIKVLVEWPAGT
jgi:threonine dehydrogenase-like Zn-dependent dehydrogenase